MENDMPVAAMTLPELFAAIAAAKNELVDPDTPAQLKPLLRARIGECSARVRRLQMDGNCSQ